MANEKHLGPYEIVALLGAGGMGEVFRARDPRIGREVAIKLLPDGWTTDADRLRRFELESRAAGSINHPNLVTIYDVGTDKGSPYIVMELLDGDTLRDKIGEGDGSDAGPRIPVRKSVDYAVQLANGLAAAHEKRIVHRDLKPENVFVTRDGRVKILDFGLAKLRAPGDSASIAGQTETQQRGTSPGTVIGTAGYMSPEQVRGQETDHRTDIFSFGAILYEMLAGRRAFRGNSAADTMSAILREDPPDISGTQPALPPILGHIVRHCLEKNPEERFQSARDLAFDLQTASGISSPSEQAHARQSRAKKTWVWIAAALVLAVGALIALRSVTRRVPPAAISTRVTQLTFQSGVEAYPSIAPDGKNFVFASKTAGHDDIYLQRIDGHNAINLTKDSPADDLQPAFSADGSSIAFRSERDGGGIFVMGATGESVRRISNFGFNPSWSPDGKEIVCSTESVVFAPQSRATNSEIWIIDVASGAKRLLTREFRGAQPVWAPHGKRIAFWGIDITAQRDLYTIDAKGGKAKPVLKDPPQDWNPIWSPDGKHLYFGSDRGGTMNLWRIAIDESAGERRGQPEQIPLPARFAAHFSISQDGQKIVYSALEMASAIRRQTLGDPGSISTVVSGSILIFSFDLSPDGKWVAFSNSGLQEDLYVASIEGGELRQITNDPYRDRAPSWTPDGRQLLFYSNRADQRYEIWRINIDGSGLTRVTEKVAESQWFPRMSPDGTQIITVDFDASQVFPVPVGGSVARKADIIPSPPGSPFRFIATGWSPDSKRVVGVLGDPVNREPAGGIAIYDLTTKRFTMVRKSGTRVRWATDGHTLAIQDGDELFMTDLNTGQIRRFPFPRHNVIVTKWNDPLWTDGRVIYWDEQLNEADIWLLTIENAKP